MFKPINNNILIEYTLPDKLRDLVYPVASNGLSKITEYDVSIFPDFTTNMTYESAILTDSFLSYVLGKTPNYLDKEAIVIDNNIGIENNTTIFVTQSFMGGMKFMVSEDNEDLKLKLKAGKEGKIRTYITPENIMAIKVDNQIKPINGFLVVQTEIDLDELATITIGDSSLKDKLLEMYKNKEKVDTVVFTHIPGNSLVSTSMAKVIASDNDEIEPNSIVSFNPISFRLENTVNYEFKEEGKKVTLLLDIMLKSNAVYGIKE